MKNKLLYLSVLVALIISAYPDLIEICGAQSKKVNPRMGESASDVLIKKEKGPSGHSTIGIVETAIKEEAEETLNNGQTELARVEAEWVTGQDHLKQTQSALESTLVELMERRPTVADAVGKDDLSEYEYLRPKKAGRAIVAVKSNVCQGCGMTLSNSRVQRARAGTELTYCSTCGRILYVP